MKNKRKQFGVTLVEMTIVVGIAALMVGLTIPAANMLLNSFESESGAKSIISSALASARAIAAKEQRYVGIRFQKRYDLNNTDPLKASQYIIFIVEDPNLTCDFLFGSYGYGFRAVAGIQPIKLPDSIGVMDFTIVSGRNLNNPINPSGQIRIDDTIAGGNTAIDNNRKLLDTSNFSIIFSPSGKLVIHGVCVWNRDNRSNNSSQDDIFNTVYNVDNSQIAMFYQDRFVDPCAVGPEPSRNNFVIYDTKKLKQTDTNLRWTNYLSQLKPVYINPYTGTIITQ